MQARGGEDEDGDNDGATYQIDMMRCLREVNVDNNTVGWLVHQGVFSVRECEGRCVRVKNTS